MRIRIGYVIITSMVVIVHCLQGSFAHFGRELDQVSESEEERRKWR